MLFLYLLVTSSRLSALQSSGSFICLYFYPQRLGQCLAKNGWMNDLQSPREGKSTIVPLRSMWLIASIPIQARGGEEQAQVTVYAVCSLPAVHPSLMPRAQSLAVGAVPSPSLKDRCCWIFNARKPVLFPPPSFGSIQASWSLLWMFCPNSAYWTHQFSCYPGL